MAMPVKRSRGGEADGATARTRWLDVPDDARTIVAHLLGPVRVSGADEAGMLHGMLEQAYSEMLMESTNRDKGRSWPLGVGARLLRALQRRNAKDKDEDEAAAVEELHDETEAREQLATSLAADTAVRALRLEAVGMGPDDAKALARGLGPNRVLWTLQINQNALGDAGGTALALALAANRTLRRLDLNACELGQAAAAALAALLRQDECPLEELSLEANSHIADPGGIDLARAVEGNKRLRKLSLARCGLLPGASAAVAQALRVNTTLRELELSTNFKVGNVGGAAIGKAIADARGVRVLSLERCALGHEACEAVAASLATNSTLLELDLSSMLQIGDRAGAAIGKALAHNATLRVLKIGGGQLAALSAAGMAEGLRHNRTLQHLDLSRNRRIKSADAITEALTVNRTLQLLDLQHTAVPAPSVTAKAFSFANRKLVVRI